MDSDDLAPARGLVNGLILSGIFYLVAYSIYASEIDLWPIVKAILRFAFGFWGYVVCRYFFNRWKNRRLPSI